MSDLRNYPAFPQFPVTGPHTGLPVPTAEGRVIRALLTGLNFSARLQISGAVNRGPGTDAGFTPPEDTWIDVGTLTVDQGGYFDIPAPARWARVVLDSGTLTHGVIEEDTRAQAGTDDVLTALGDVYDALGTIPQQAQALFAPKLADIDAALANTAQTRESVLAQQQQNNAQAALAAGRMSATSVATMGTTPGLYTITSGPEVGWVVERKADGDQIRRPELEAAPAPELFSIKRTMDARLSQLKAGTLDPGSMSRIFDEAGPLDVVTAAQGPAVDNVTVFALAGGKKAVRDYVDLSPRIFGLDPKRTASQNVTALGQLADWQHTHMGYDIPNMAYGGARIVLPPGRYRIGDQTTPLKGNIAIESTHPRAAIIEHEGTGDALLINGTTRRVDQTPADYRVASIYLKHLTIRSPEGRGVFIGSSVNPYIVFDGCEITEIKNGYAIDTGERVYFISFLNGLIIGINRGIYHAPYGDLLFVMNSKIATAREAMIVSEGPTLRLLSNNFEGCADPTAMIHLRPGDVASTFAMITHNRFGQEGYARDFSLQTAPYDIAFVTNNANTGYSQATITNNEFITTATHENRDANGNLVEAVYQKQAPILANLSLVAVDLRNNRRSAAYATGALVTSSDVAKVQAGTWGAGGITVDRPSDADPIIRGIVDILSPGKRTLQAVIPNYAPNFPAGTCAGYVSGTADRAPIVEAAKYQYGPLRRLGGWIEYAAPDLGPVQMDTPGSIVTVPLTIPAGTPAGAPVWVGADGLMTLTPPTVTRQIGVLLESAGGTPQVRIEIGRHLAVTTMPTAESWTAGEVVDLIAPTVAGTAGSQYVLLGYRRLTTGSGHVLGVDWVERREVTGT